MSIVPTAVPMTAELAGQTIQTLAETYPFLRTETVATTAFGRPIRAVTVGTGPRRVLYSGAHHANEWLTATVLLKFIEDFAAAIESGGTVGGTDARELARTAVEQHPEQD